MEINEDTVFADEQEIGTYDLYDTDHIAVALTSDEQLREALQQGTDTILEVLHNAVDQRVIADFQIVHRS